MVVGCWLSSVLAASTSPNVAAVTEPAFPMACCICQVGCAGQAHCCNPAFAVHPPCLVIGPAFCTFFCFSHVSLTSDALFLFAWAARKCVIPPLAPLHTLRAHALTTMSLIPRRVLHKGTLVKMGSLIRSWKQRFFILEIEELRYFASEGGSTHGVMPLSPECGVAQYEVVKDGSTEWFPFVIVTASGRTLHMRAESAEARDAWCDKIREAISLIPSFQLDGTPMQPWTHPTCAGLLTKLGHVRKNWRRRFFILVRGQLSYYKKEGALWRCRRHCGS